MAIYQVDPIHDSRWPELLERSSCSSVFHSRSWLSALRRSYGYEAVVVTTCPPRRELTNGVVLCRINSWVTGKRMVSLPFSDHCEPIVSDPGDAAEIFAFLQNEVKSQHLNFLEIRPSSQISETNAGFRQAESFCLHKVDLRAGPDELFRRLHKDSIRRKIQRAEREGLLYEKGTDHALLEKFYGLFVMTRRRHGLPPSPMHWFKHLLHYFGARAQVRVASKDGQPVAGIFTLSDERSITYKYGGSDQNFNNLGGTPFLFWRLMLEAQEAGLGELDLGRSDLNNEGLITFKERLGGVRSPLVYLRLSKRVSIPPRQDWKRHIAHRMLTYASDPVRITVGNLFYRHFG